MTGDEHTNAARVRRYYAALEVGDAQTLVELIHPSCVFHLPGNSPLAGEYHGIEEIAPLGMQAIAETQGTWRTEILSVLANDAFAITLHRWTAQRRADESTCATSMFTGSTPMGESLSAGSSSKTKPSTTNSGAANFGAETQTVGPQQTPTHARCCTGHDWIVPTIEPGRSRGRSAPPFREDRLLKARR